MPSSSYLQIKKDAYFVLEVVVARAVGTEVLEQALDVGVADPPGRLQPGRRPGARRHDDP